ncbi:MAG: tetratricopeptide repeat protein [candidate division Zixibacteria bacterium]|nr:tetratricopeptide repeat protein [candidate division Zixibacteria bacterium]
MKSACELPDFQLIGQLGQGGTADVVRVRTKRFDREAALKFPKTQGDSSVDFLRLIEREHRLAGRLKYPGLVRILEISLDPPPYLLMELCSGPTLDTIGRVDDVMLAMNLLSSAAVNLEYLRAQGIIHGDIKPHNLFLPANWPDLGPAELFHIKLSDLSLGRFSHEPEESRAGIGTVGYVAPETLAANQTSYKSDLFALGVIAYQVLSGVHPFMDDDSDPVKTNSRVREADCVPLADIRPDLPRGLRELVTQLLTKDPDRRPESGWQVCRALRNAGAVYPYERAIRPAHLVDMTRSYSDNKNALVTVSADLSDRLDHLTDGDNTKLRCLLTGNFNRNNLAWEGGRFAFRKDIYWPALMRRRTLQTFREKNYRHKKAVVRCSLIGGIKAAVDLGLVDDSSAREMPAALPDLVRQFLSQKTVLSLSAKYASLAERSSALDAAARLHVQAGNLARAENAAYQAASTYWNANRTPEALLLLNTVISFAATSGHYSKVRQLLMLKADILKDNGDTDRAMRVYEQLLEVSRGLPRDKLLAETFKDLGDLYKVKRKTDAGIAALKEALSIYEELHDELEISHTYNNLGNIYWLAMDAAASLKSFRRALKIQRKLGVTGTVALTLNNIGSLFGSQGRYGRAATLLNMSLKLSREVGRKVEIARTLNNLGYTYFYSGRPDASIDCLKESLAINRDIGTKKELLFNYENLTSIMMTSCRLNESLQYLREGLALSQQLGDKAHLATFNLQMGMTLTRMGRFEQADRAYSEAAALTAEIDDEILERMLDTSRANLRFHLGDTQEALRMAIVALERADQKDDKPSMITALLLITRISDDRHYLQRAEVTAGELRLTREKLVLEFNRLEHLATRHRIDEALALATTVSKQIHRIPNDLELPRFYNSVAEVMLAAGRPDEAVAHLQKGNMIAGRCGLRPEMITNLTLQGRAKEKDGEYEACYQCYRKALELCRQMTDEITNDVDRRFFKSQRSIQFLEKEIRGLRKVLMQK